MASRRRRRLRARAGRRRRSPDEPSARSASAATTMPRRPAAPRSTGSTRMPGRPWNGPATTISGPHARVARRPPAAPARSRLHARPRQPARPDLGVRDHGGAGPGRPVGHLDRARPARPHPRPDRVHRGRRPDADVSRRVPATRSPSARAGRSSIRAASASRATAIRGRATSILDLEAGTATWGRVAYDIEAVRARCEPPGCPRRLGRSVARWRLTAAVIGGRRPLQGRKPGDRRVRVERPHAPYFRYTGKGQLTAKEAASAPTTPGPTAFASIRGLLFGRPLASEEELGERLSQEEGAGDLQLGRHQLVGLRDRGDPARPDPRRRRRPGLRLQVSIADQSVLLVAVAISYRQICIAYPTGGGSYAVSRRNIGRTVSLIAASALLIDYVMTVAVSTSSAVEQITSAFPVAVSTGACAHRRQRHRADHDRQPPRPARGGQHLRRPDLPVRRLGAADDRRRGVPDHRPRRGRTATPSRSIAAGRRHPPAAHAAPAVTRLRGRRRGPDRDRGDRHGRAGLQAARGEERRVDARLSWRRCSRVLFIGITFLAVNFGITPIEFPEKQTVISQVARTVYGDGLLFYLFQAFTALLLFLAANTSFNAFPRLLAILAGDGHMPRQFALRGDRLAFSYGILVLGGVAAGADRRSSGRRPTC